MKISRYCYRLWVKMYSRIVREKATPTYIARGWAIGMFYGCLAPFGGQLILSIPTAFWLRGSKIGATFGTLLTNHFTIFFIYPAQCYVGNRLLGGDLTYAAIRTAMEHVLQEQSWQALLQIGWDLVSAFFVGGALLTAVMTPLTYFGVRTLVDRYQRAKARRRAAGQERGSRMGQHAAKDEHGSTK